MYEDVVVSGHCGGVDGYAFHSTDNQTPLYFMLPKLGSPGCVYGYIYAHVAHYLEQDVNTRFHVCIQANAPML